MSDTTQHIWLDAKVDDNEIPVWKQLDVVCRKWATLSMMEKDLSDYQKRKELYE